jgi:hypothetical protein
MLWQATAELASCSTLCQLENRAVRKEAWLMHEVLFEQFVSSFAVSDRSKPATLRKAKLLRGTGDKSVQWSMSNFRKMSLQTTIYSLTDRGWSQRRIANELGINR